MNKPTVAQVKEAIARQLLERFVAHLDVPNTPELQEKLRQEMMAYLREQGWPPPLEITQVRADPEVRDRIIITISVPYEGELGPVELVE